jgi:hypothetical protein
MARRFFSDWGGWDVNLFNGLLAEDHQSRGGLRRAILGGALPIAADAR